MKNFKEELRILINDLKNSTGLTQEQLSIAAGYSPKTLTQALSKKEGHEKVIRQLRLIDWGKVDKTTISTVEKNKGKSSIDSNVSIDEYIHSLKDQIQTLKNHCSFLEKTVLTNFDVLTRNQVIVQAQLSAVSRRESERFAGADKKKLQEEFRILDKYVSEAAKEVL